MGIVIQKSKNLALGMGLSQAEANKVGEEEAAEEEGNGLAAGADEESGEGHQQ